MDTVEPLRAPRRPVLGVASATADNWVAVAVGLWLVVGLTCTGVWALVGASGRWPLWVWLAVGGPVFAGVALRAAWRVSPGPARWAAAHAGLALVASGLLAFVWAVTGAGTWLWWPLLGIAVAFSVHALLAFADRLPPRPRERALSARVDQLQRTRRGALDVQADERRRLERDLHDGAQSRLVALGMLLARAEDRVAPESEAADLLRRARGEVGAAVSELRDLAHGLAPPLLVGRGLGPAVEALALRTPVHARVVADVPRRLSPELESAAYFVAAEALTNVLKHAPEARAVLTLTATRDTLSVEVADAGPGGADERGSGLAGLRRRVEALDGRLDVISGPAGTTVRAELPCGP
jgi:signal transduction histidine kinase